MVLRAKNDCKFIVKVYFVIYHVSDQMIENL